MDTIRTGAENIITKIQPLVVDLETITGTELDERSQNIHELNTNLNQLIQTYLHFDRRGGLVNYLKKNGIEETRIDIHVNKCPDGTSFYFINLQSHSANYADSYDILNECVAEYVKQLNDTINLLQNASNSIKSASERIEEKVQEKNPPNAWGWL